MPELKVPSLNVVLIAGRLVDDPFPLKGKEDITGAAFVVAANKYAPGKKQIATFVSCICWNDTAKAVLASCAKGSPVLVTGSLAQHEKTVGKTTTRVLQVSAAQVQFLAVKPAE
jgi:single-stranded DNA-binding protein